MTFYEKLKKSLPAEVFTQVEEALGDDFDFDVVPRTRLNKVIAQRNELRDKLAETAEEGAGQVDLDKYILKTDHEAALTEAAAGTQAAVQELKLQYAGLDKLRSANAADPELVWNSLIDKTKLTFNEKNELVGLDEQVTELAKNKSFLFPKPEGGAGGGTGKGGAGGSGTEPTALDAALSKVFGAYGVGDTVE